MSTEVYNDCCEFCIKNDPSPTREIDPCTEMTKRCSGDTCRTCKPCKAFAQGTEYTNAFVILQRKPARVRFAAKPQTPPSPEEADLNG